MLAGPPRGALPLPPVVMISPAATPLATQAGLPSSDWLAASAPASSIASGPAPSLAPALSPTEPPRSSRGDPIALEAAELKRGLELKHAGELASAISVLEGYRRGHPKGTFSAEATLAELDAMLTLGHRNEASRLLQEVEDNPAGPRSAELRLLRAELNAQQGHCAEALAGFDTSLAIPSVAERALYGRASCEQALGRFREGREGFEDYLARYPHGVLAAEARRALDGIEGRREK